MFERIPPRGAGFGAEQFAIRGSSALPLSQAAALRPSYNEYPERGGLPFGFPAPGKRGPSKAPAHTGVGAPAPGSGGGTYPPDYERQPIIGTIGAGGALVGPHIYSQIEGDHYPFSGGFTAGQIRVFSSIKIGPGFVVTRCAARIDANHTTSNFLLYLRVGSDPDTSQGVNTLGVDLDINNAAGWNNMTAAMMESTPYRRFPDGGRYLKVIGVNNDSVFHFLQGGIDFAYLGGSY